jgi:hypothetical protein
MRRRSAILMLACAFAGVGCPQMVQFYSDCGEPQGDEGETVPPSPEAGAGGAGLDGPVGEAPD